MAADKPLRSRGAAKAASISNKEKGPTRPAPRLIPSSAKRREVDGACPWIARGKFTERL